jgi:hypothetical protein
VAFFHASIEDSPVSNRTRKVLLLPALLALLVAGCGQSEPEPKLKSGAAGDTRFKRAKSDGAPQAPPKGKAGGQPVGKSLERSFKPAAKELELK